MERQDHMRLTLLGPPGSGKGTQATRIAGRLRLPAIHVGALLRRHADQKSPLGTAVEPFLRRGDLVPDPLVTRMVLERLAQPDCASGFVLDGFPRTIGQAEALDRHLEARAVTLDAACYLEVPDDELWRRLLGRGRSDDDERVARHRLAVFTAQTRPLLDHYRRRGRLVVVDAVGPPDVVSERILGALARRVDAGIPPPPGRCGNGGLVS
jgi:adenylate kinase